jgi:hypothetical protein
LEAASEKISTIPGLSSTADWYSDASHRRGRSSARAFASARSAASPQTFSRTSFGRAPRLHPKMESISWSSTGRSWSAPETLPAAGWQSSTPAVPVVENTSRNESSAARFLRRAPLRLRVDAGPAGVTPGAAWTARSTNRRMFVEMVPRSDAA